MLQNFNAMNMNIRGLLTKQSNFNAQLKDMYINDRFLCNLNELFDHKSSCRSFVSYLYNNIVILKCCTKVYIVTWLEYLLSVSKG